MNWEARTEIVEAGRIVRYHILEEGQALKYAQFLERLVANKEFRAFYNKVLSESEFSAYQWEHPAATATQLEKPYEFVLVHSTQLTRVTAEPEVFASYFRSGEGVVDFPNLRGDAHLIVPTLLGPVSHYPHLGSFVRQADSAQIDAFWRRVGRCFLEQYPQGKLWLSTAGLGVYWLHVRMDSVPKYYRFGGYK